MFDGMEDSAATEKVIRAAQALATEARRLELTAADEFLTVLLAEFLRNRPRRDDRRSGRVVVRG